MIYHVNYITALPKDRKNTLYEAFINHVAYSGSLCIPLPCKASNNVNVHLQYREANGVIQE